MYAELIQIPNYLYQNLKDPYSKKSKLELLYLKYHGVFMLVISQHPLKKLMCFTWWLSV